MHFMIRAYAISIGTREMQKADNQRLFHVATSIFRRVTSFRSTGRTLRTPVHLFRNAQLIS